MDCANLLLDNHFPINTKAKIIESFKQILITEGNLLKKEKLHIEKFQEISDALKKETDIDPETYQLIVETLQTALEFTKTLS